MTVFPHIQRELAAEPINSLLRHPDVSRDVANTGEVIDVSRAVDDPRNVFLRGEHGCVCLFCIMPGVFEAHSAVLRSGRGQWTLDFLKAGTHFMFTRTEAYEIMTRVPDGHFAARAAAVRLGYRREFHRENECRFRDKIVGFDVWSYRVQDWVNQAAGLAERGAWVHARMHQEAERLGITDKPHEDDENHNRIVGATYEMIVGGQAVKGCALYNRWAAICRHPRIALLSVDPPTIRFDIGVMRLRPDGDIEVERVS